MRRGSNRLEHHSCLKARQEHLPIPVRFYGIACRRCDRLAALTSENDSGPTMINWYTSSDHTASWSPDDVPPKFERESQVFIAGMRAISGRRTSAGNQTSNWLLLIQTSHAPPQFNLKTLLWLMAAVAAFLDS